ncbi:MAG TPA: AI-2E family transporter, partial [Bdellovibrionota bacterium]|nr:AI-2E family transporter [Bdellovibrionota bacterium]
AIGIGLGVIVSPAVNWAQSKYSIPRGVGGVILFLFWALLFSGIGYIVYILVWEQLGDLISKLPALLEKVRTVLAERFSRVPGVSSNLKNMNWGAMVSASLGTLGWGLQAAAAALTAVVYVIVISVYYAMQRERYASAFLTLFPHRMHASARAIMRDTARALRRWIGAQLIAMSAVGLCASVAFLIIGIDYWAVLGALTGLLDIIPYVGPLIAALCAVVVTLGSEPDKLWMVVVAFLVVQQIEANLVIPLVLRDRVELPPVHLMTLMLVLAQWFGVIGILLAPPLLAVGRVLWLEIYVPSINSGKLEVEPRKKKAA